MTSKDKQKLLILFLFVLFFFILPLFSDIPTDQDCPAPENLESMDVYQFLSREVEGSLSPEQALNAFVKMCEMDVDCRDDRILLESYYFEETETYYLHLARQFQFSNSTEFVQLHLDLAFSLSKDMPHPDTLAWHITAITDLTEVLSQWQAFLAVKDLTPSDIKVSIDWTW